MTMLPKARIAILATHGFEESELKQPLEALREAGADVDIVSLESDPIRAWADGDWGDKYTVDVTVADASVDQYEALILPGGTINPDKLRRDEQAIAFIRDFAASGKPVAAICHAPWLLCEADLLRGRRATSFHSIRTDVSNAGAEWVDQDVVQDANLITSRNPGDLPAFIDAVKTALREQIPA